VVNTERFINPEDIGKGNVKGGEFQIPGAAAVSIQGRSIYYIANEDLSHDGLKALAAQGGNTAYMDKMAWVRFGIDSKSANKEAKEMEVHIRAANAGDLDADKIAALVEKAYALGNASKSTFNNAADKKKIMDFIRTEVVKFKGKGTITTNPNITIFLNINKEITEIGKAPVPIVTITTNGDETGAKLKNGDPDVRTWPHEVLFWCSYPNGGKPYGLETGEQHKAHTQPGK